MKFLRRETQPTFYALFQFKSLVSKSSCFSTQLLKKDELLPPTLFMFINVYSVYVEFNSAWGWAILLLYSLLTHLSHTSFNLLYIFPLIFYALSMSVLWVYIWVGEFGAVISYFCSFLLGRCFIKKTQSLFMLLILSRHFHSGFFLFQPSHPSPFPTTLQLPTTTARLASSLLEPLI